MLVQRNQTVCLRPELSHCCVRVRCLTEWPPEAAVGQCRPLGSVNGYWTAFTPRFSNQLPLKAHSPIHAHIHAHIHSHNHTPTATVESTPQCDSPVRVRRLAQGHLDTQLGGAGNWTSNLQVTSRPAVPPEPDATQYPRLGASGCCVTVCCEAVVVNIWED